MQKYIIFSLTILLFSINSVFADDSEIDLEYEVYQHPWLQLREPTLEINESNTGFDFKITFEDGVPDSGGDSWTGLAFAFETMRFGDIEKFELDARTLRVAIIDSEGIYLNNTQYKITSTGENKFETDGKTREEVYRKWHEQSENWNELSELDQKTLTTWRSLIQTPITPEPIDVKHFFHIMNNRPHFDPAQYILEGHIESELFKHGEKFTFSVGTPGSYNDSIGFAIRDKTTEEINPVGISVETPKVLTDDEKEQRSEQFLTDIEEQQRIQQEKALKDYEDRKKQKELDKQTEEIIIKSEQVDSQIIEPIQEEPIPEYEPEPIMDPEPPEPKCGQGTIEVDGFCKVIEKENNFLDLILKFFSNFFDI